MKDSSFVHVDSTDVGCSDHYYLVKMKLGRTTKTTEKAKRVVRKWHLEKFEDKEVNLISWRCRGAIGFHSSSPSCVLFLTWGLCVATWPL